MKVWPRPPFAFYLGVAEPVWAEQLNVPLFVSASRLDRYRRRGDGFPHAQTRVALDSGGFSEIKSYGTWRTSADDFGGRIYRFMEDGWGYVDWCAPQDWMCEPDQVVRTGLTVKIHQQLTVENFVYLEENFPHARVIPVLQGYRLDEYLECEQMYRDAGVDLSAYGTVGIGSVCRRSDTQEIADIITEFAGRYPLHGFGVKVSGLARYGHLLQSADSMAWSFAARKRNLRLPGCEHPRCTCCQKWALQWRDQVLASMRTERHPSEHEDVPTIG